MNELGIGAAHIFGYSLGGWIAFELIATHPSRVRSAISGGAHPYAEDLSGLRSLTPVAILSLWDALHAPLSAESRTRLSTFDPGILREIVRDRIDLCKRLDGLSHRALMICGSADGRFDGMRRFSAAGVHREFVAISEADHLQACMRCDAVVPLVTAFLRGTSPA